ncbi:MAG: rod-binding protein [Treponema sp.]|jgi:flagellar protein FlgJ|nr:rod-binding protein [Treponema sp.]
MAIQSINNAQFERGAFGSGMDGVSAAASAPSAAATTGEKGAFDSLIQSLESAAKDAAASEKSAVSGASGKPVIDKTSALYEQCEALESFLLKNLLNSMRNTIQKSGFIDQGFAGDMYEDMLYDEYAKNFTKDTNFGFAEIAYLELTGQRGTVINEKF